MEITQIDEEYNRIKFRLNVNDPELECVTNLICYGFLLINHVDKSNRHQLSREFEKRCFIATKFFESSAVSGNDPQDRIALVRDGSAWVSDVKRWVNAGLFGRCAPDRINYLYDQQRELIARCKIMAIISIDEIKADLVKIIRDKLTPEEPAEKKQITTPAKRWKIVTKKITGWIFKKTSHLICALIVAVVAAIIAAIIIDILADFGLLERIKAFFTE